MVMRLYGFLWLLAVGIVGSCRQAVSGCPLCNSITVKPYNPITVQPYGLFTFFDIGSMSSVTQMLAPTTQPLPMVMRPRMVALE